MGAPQREQASCTHTAPPRTYPEMALQTALPCNWQHPRPALLHAHVPAASPACLTPSVPLLHPDHLNNLPTTWNNWEFARITSSSAQLTDRNKTRNVTCLQSQEVHTVDASLRLRASLTAPITKGLPFLICIQTGSKFLSQVLNSVRLVLLGVCYKPFSSTARKESKRDETFWEGFYREIKMAWDT